MSAVATIAAPETGRSQAPAFRSGPVFANVSYGPSPENLVDYQLPVARANGAPLTRPAPVILFIHGGGWHGGSRLPYRRFLALYSSAGIAAFTIDYRLIRENDPSSYWPAQLEDAQLAVRWIRANAARFHIDPRRICAYGDSAGGQLSQYLGYQPATLAGDRASLYPGIPSNVMCVVDKFGPTSWGPKLLKPNAPPISALGFAGPHAVPTFIEQGTEDRLVKPTDSQALHERLQGNGVEARLVMFPGGHEYAGLTEPQKGALYQQELQWVIAHLHP